MSDSNHEPAADDRAKSTDEPPTDDVAATAARIADALLDEGIAILPRPAVVRRVKAALDRDAIDHDAVREGFATAGWAYSRHVYFEPDELRARADGLAGELREANHLLLTEEEVLDRVAAPVERGDQDGWRRGKAVSVVRSAFEDDGWLVREVTAGGSGRTFYLLPLFEVVADLHPNGRHPFSTDEIFRYYVSQSIRGTVGRE